MHSREYPMILQERLMFSDQHLESNSFTCLQTTCIYAQVSLDMTIETVMFKIISLLLKYTLSTESECIYIVNFQKDH